MYAPLVHTVPSFGPSSFVRPPPSAALHAVHHTPHIPIPSACFLYLSMAVHPLLLTGSSFVAYLSTCVCVCQCDFFSFPVSYDGFECEYFFIQYFITCLIHSGLSSPHCYIYLRIWSVFIILPDLHILVSIFGCTV